MKLISLKKITDNMTLARNVYTREGNVLLAKGAPLKQNYAAKLSEWGVNSVYINDDQGDFVEIDQDLCQMAQENVQQLISGFFSDINQDQIPEATKKTIQDIMNQLIIDKNVINNLVEIKSLHEDIFRHCVTVSLLSMIIGSFAGYNSHQLYELAVGAILVDLGKTAMLNQFLADPSQLSTMENSELQKHPQLGFDKFRSLKNNYESAAKVILQHHEKFDGSGYPQNLKGEEIHEYARIASIADNFHGFRLKIRNDNDFSLNHLLDYLQKNSGSIFDPKFIQIFSEKISLFEKQSTELVNNKFEVLSETYISKESNKLDINSHKQPSNKKGIPNNTSESLPDHIEIPKTPKSSQRNFFSIFENIFSKDSTPIIGDEKSTESSTLVQNQSLNNISAPQNIDKKKKGKENQSNTDLKPTKIDRNLQRIEKNKKNVSNETSKLIVEPTPALSSHKKIEYKIPCLDFSVTPERCHETKTDLLNIARKTLAKISTDLIPEKVLIATQNIINELLTDQDIIHNLVTIKALDDNTFSHCISVSLLSIMTGASLGYSSEQLKELGIGSMLADLGKVELSKRFLVDSRSVGSSEYRALMSEHTQFGFERLWELKKGSSAAYVALQHHESYDGSGFPAGLKGDQIHLFSRIVALADAYETLIHEGENGQKLMPHEVIEYIRDHSGSRFDPELSRAFLQNVTPFLIGSNVLLNTGEKAKVVKLNKDLLARPVIRILSDKNGKDLDKPYCKDLVEDLTLFIVAALDDDEL